MKGISILTTSTDSYFNLCLLVVGIVFAPPASEAGCKVYQSTHVDCTFRGLTAVPTNLPSSTTHLNLSYNDITKLTPSCFENLHSLEELTMQISEDLNVDSHTFNRQRKLRSLIFPCSGCVTFGKGTFRPLSSLQTLDVGIKTFLNATDDMFSSLINLSKLTIRRPAIDVKYPYSVFLPSSLFRGLKNLEQLTVIGSSGSSLENFSSESFKDLVRLKIIDFDIDQLKCDDIKNLRPLKNLEIMQFNSITAGEHCNLTFSHFPRLREVEFDTMYIDSPLPIFNWSKSFLHNLRLYVEVQWNNNGRQDKTLTRLWRTNVSHLSIGIAGLNRIDLPSFKYMLNGLQKVNIYSLDVSYLLNFKEKDNHTETIFESLAGSNVHELDISGTALSVNIAPNTFQWLTQLETLRMNSCHLDDDFFVSFNVPLTLTTLILSKNKFQNLTKLMSGLSDLNNLRYINIRANMFTGRIPQYAFRNHRSLTSIDLTENNFQSIDLKSFSFLSNLKHLDLSYNNIEMVPNGAFHALQSLNTLRLNNNPLAYIEETGKSNYPFKNLGNLTVLALSTLVYNNDLIDTPRLENLHIEDNGQACYTTVFHNTFPLKHLTVLTIKHADFINLYSTETTINTKVINVQPRRFLRILRLPFNNFYKLDFSSLNEFRNLEELSIEHNKLSVIHGVPDKLNKLEILKLSDNLITVISPEMLTLLPSLRLLEVNHNPFDCSCKLKPFKDWLSHDRKVIVYSPGIANSGKTCSSPPEKCSTPVDLVELGFECDLVFIISFAVTCSVGVVIVTVIMVMRFHWHMRFAYFHIKLRLGGYQLQINDEEQPINKRYDAFVVYNQHDSDWVIHELVPHLEKIDPPNFKLCIHERDFIPGNDIFDNILDSIEQSKKTMLILSPDFAASEWCYFEMRMAQSCLFEQKRDVIVMISLKNIQDDDMPRILRNILLTKSYLEWPENDIGRRLFWEKLKVELRSDSRVNRVANL